MKYKINHSKNYLDIGNTALPAVRASYTFVD